MITMTVKGPCLMCSLWFTYGDFVVFILDAEMESTPVHLACALDHLSPEETK